MNMIERLYQSFNDLEIAVNTAKATLLRKSDVPSYIIDRLDSYDNIMLKQKSLAAELEQSIANKDAENITRIVKLINGLSEMIRDDARELLTYLYKLKGN